MKRLTASLASIVAACVLYGTANAACWNQAPPWGNVTQVGARTFKSASIDWDYSGIYVNWVRWVRYAGRQTRFFDHRGTAPYIVPIGHWYVYAVNITSCGNESGLETFIRTVDVK